MTPVEEMEIAPIASLSAYGPARSTVAGRR